LSSKLPKVQLLLENVDKPAQISQVKAKPRIWRRPDLKSKLEKDSMKKQFSKLLV